MLCADGAALMQVLTFGRRFCCGHRFAETVQTVQHYCVMAISNTKRELLVLKRDRQGLATKNYHAKVWQGSIANPNKDCQRRDE